MIDVKIGRYIKLYARWFDFWVGVFYNQPSHTLYIQPIPCLGIRIELSGKL
jgi:hypothetical protein